MSTPSDPTRPGDPTRPDHRTRPDDPTSPAEPAGWSDTRAADLPAELPAGTVLLDVREDVEWTAGHAPAAVHVPLGQLPARLDAVRDAERVVVVCRVGGRSAQAAQLLAANGTAAVNVSDGMLGWHLAGRAMVSEDGQDPTVV